MMLGVGGKEGSMRLQAAAAAADRDALAVRLGPDERGVDELHFFVQTLDLLHTKGQHLATLELHVHRERALVTPQLRQKKTASPEQHTK